VPDAVTEIIGTYFEAARLLGQRTGERDLALASDPDNRDFAARAVHTHYQRSLVPIDAECRLVRHFDWLRRELKTVFPNRAAGLPKESACLGGRTHLAGYRAVYQTPMAAVRIRCHCNFISHVLHPGKDFVINDF